MRHTGILPFSLCAMLWACNTTPSRETPAQHTSVRFTAEDTLAMERCAEMLDTMIFPKVDTPIWGYRFRISGDFNGDGAEETFYEHYYSRRDKRETNKYYSGNEDIYDLDRISNDKDVLSFMSCDSCGVDTLPVYGVTGPLFVKNEGDLDGDGGDEVGFVPALPQMSSMNHYHILSYKGRHWVEVYSFGIRE